MKINNKINKRKGSFLVSGISFFMISLMLSVFGWDIARILYYKVYNQNLASTLAISVVNESGYYLSDSIGVKTKGFLVTNHYYKNQKYPKGFKGTPADDPTFLKDLVKKNTPLSPDVKIVKYDLNNNYQNYEKYITGSNGIHGEAKITTTLEIDMFLSNIVVLFGKGKSSSIKRISNTATAIPLYVGKGNIIIDWNSISDGKYVYTGVI